MAGPHGGIELFRILAAAALTPLAAGAAWAAALQAAAVASEYRATLPFTAGFLLYAALHGRVPPRAYVLAHELTHALAAALTGVRVRRIKVGASSGYVTMSGTSTFITLAPYFFPFYLLVFALAVSALAVFYDISPYRPWLSGGAGLLASFHLVNTAALLAGPMQSDFRKAGGLFFSLTLLVLVNSAFLVLAMKAVYPGLVPLGACAARGWETAALIYGRAWAAVLYIFNTAKIYLENAPPR